MLRPLIYCFVNYLSLVHGVTKSGLLLLYRPLDVSYECAFSDRMRYDLSFGMGMSDTITMVFRTLTGIDYACNIEIAAPTEDVYLVVVIKFPKNLLQSCSANEDAFMVMKKNKCIRVCDLLGERNLYSPYYVITVKGRLRFRYLNNSSINADINAEMHQLTATSARIKLPSQKCYMGNETLCIVNDQKFCFTSGVVCDGIKNCGVKNWFDEHLSECSLPVEYLSYASVIAVVAALVCAVLVTSQILVRCLPSVAGSFFIFNANEDNRFCIDPILQPPQEVWRSFEKSKKSSLIPVVSSSSSDDTSKFEGERKATYPPDSSPSSSLKGIPWTEKRAKTVKTVTAKLHEKLRFISGLGKLIRTSELDQQMNPI